ncbi:MAG: hypothetical protein ACI3ZM_02105 [Candidatus Cryptobacteroides sp.]
MIRQNHQSDFTIVEYFREVNSSGIVVDRAVPERVRLEFLTLSNKGRFLAERRGPVFENCALSDDGKGLEVYIPLSQCYLGTGELMVIMTEYLDDTNFPNGIREKKTTGKCGVLLWRGNSGVYSSIDSGIGGEGPVSGGSGDKNFVFSQSTPSSAWTINHKLDKFPAVSVMDSAGTAVYGDIEYVDENTCIIRFNYAFSGKAILN